MVGAYLQNCDAASRRIALSRLRRVGCKNPAEVRFFGLNAPLKFGLEGEEEIAVSILSPIHQPESLEAVYVDPNLALVPNAWGHAFLSYLVRSLRMGGIACLPCPAGDFRTACSWTQPWIEARLGEPERLVALPAWERVLSVRGIRTLITGRSRQENQMAIYRQRGELPTAPSVLQWWFRDQPEAAAAALDFLAKGEDSLDMPLAETCREFLLSPAQMEKDQHRESACLPASSPAGPTGGGEDVANSLLSNYGRTMTYALLGASPKSCVIDAILRSHVPAEGPLHLVDHGGGLGFVLMELLLANPRIERAINCDSSPRYLAFSVRAFDHLRERLAGRYFAACQKSEDFTYDGPCHAVSFIGSLLYLPRQEVLGALVRAWEALLPGGVLIVHENMKNRRYKRDYQVMFTGEELEALLNRFGPIQYYHATRPERLDSLPSPGKTVFRFVQKVG